MRLKEGYSYKEGREGHSLGCRGGSSQTFFRTSSESKTGERTYRWDVVQVLMVLLSPSRSSLVVVSVSVPTSDTVGE